MAIAHDIYAETNPAYCAALLTHFVSGYCSRRNTPPDITLCYAALPLALSGDLASTFAGTDRRTGLLEWLHRSPVIQIRLADRVNGSLDIVTEAIRFACFSQLLMVNAEGRLVLGVSPLRKVLTKQLSEETQKIFKNIDRLGCWFALAGTTRTVFDMMGLEL
uniref:three component ABC system middle component n=1 Tax=Pseudomonas laurentiana TaxID=2364649 RepID=UPI0029C6AEF0|nr:three component ABC system middle component [Pseudomonas laurentiana]